MIPEVKNDEYYYNPAHCLTGAYMVAFLERCHSALPCTDATVMSN